MLASLILRRRRERSLLRRHPWIFSGGVERIDGNPAPGDTIEVHDSTGKWIARAAQLFPGSRTPGFGVSATALNIGKDRGF